ncbi:MAG: TVP38/TMEM64 family protein [Pirellulaceae bacterium]|jgi:uncharacterized membrane protein YdjX (TVP38/TMEM64 family)|nr:TVP38/TMEM64 family protein [Pirellulaceae bacterium]MDP7014691.1 TVP38/TMEM64 family protein [Pirellulaceae bacterium]
MDYEEPAATSKRSQVVRIALLCLLLAVIALGYVRFGDSLSLENLAQRETQLREFQRDHLVLVYGAAFTLYVLVTGLSLPGAAGLSLVYGWYFGAVQGVFLVSFASTAGATIAFLLSRHLLGGSVQRRFGDRLTAFNENLRRQGAFYLFTLRLIPAAPFFVINIVMGLTPMRATTFWWVSQLGMLPGTIVYLSAGASVPDLATLAERGAGGVLTWNTIIAFSLLGLFPFIVKWIMGRFARNVAEPSKTTVE